jgi:hypothetical protein
MEPAELFSYELEKLYERVLKDFQELLKSNLITKEEILNEDFQELLNEYGYKEIEERYINSLTDIAFRFGNPSPDMAAMIDVRRDLTLELLVGKKLQTGSKFKQLIYDMIDRPLPAEEFELRKAEIKLTDAQFNAAFTTAIADTSREGVRLAYEDDPNAKFEYIGGLNENSSKQCRWLMLNQKSEGYTTLEIDAGIDSPYVDNEGNVLKIMWCGRVPNFNCRHQWLPKGKKKNASAVKLP